jgi:hypothetical protein
MEDKRFPALRRMVYDNERETEFTKKCICVLQNQVDDLSKTIANVQEQLITLQSALGETSEETEETDRRVNLDAKS